MKDSCPPQSSHHLYGVEPNGNLNTYSFNPHVKTTSKVTIWKLKKLFKLFDIYLSLRQGTYKKSSARFKDIDFLCKTFNALRDHQDIDRRDLQKTIILLLRLGASGYLKHMQHHLSFFKPGLTPQYIEVISKMNFDIPPKDELIFHTCNPDVYLWMPEPSKKVEKVIIIFGTISNTLNMPRPMAHFLLSKLGVALMYIKNHKGLDMPEVFHHHDMNKAAEPILKIMQSHQLKTAYGLGVSFGGFRICEMARLLKLKRVLNFSGAKINRGSNKWVDEVPNIHDYPLENILTIFSKQDKTDQDLESMYQRKGFLTKKAWVDSKTHGSFSAAFLEDKLPSLLAWLIEEEELSSTA